MKFLFKDKTSYLLSITEIITGCFTTIWIYLEYILFKELSQLSNQDNIVKLLIVNICCILIFALFSFVNSWLENKVKKNLAIRIRNMVLNNISQTKDYDFQKETANNFISWFDVDSRSIYSKVVLPFFDTLKTISVFLSLTIILMIISWKIGLILFAFSIFYSLIPFAFLRMQYKWNNDIVKYINQAGSKQIEFLNGYEIFYFMNKEKYFKFITSEKVYKLHKEVYKKLKLIVLTEIISSISTVINISLFALIVCYFIVFQDENIALLSVIISFSVYLIQNWKSFLNNFQKLISTGKVYKTKYKWDIESNKPTKKSIEFQELKINNLSFSYNENQIFKDFNFTFKKGKKYAVIGPSGSGKSTLLNLILKENEEYEGQILFNDNDLKNIDNHEYKNSLMFLRSNEFIFLDTIKNNITLWEDADKEELNNILQKLNLEELNLELMIEDESMLSTGQKQRINFARYFYSNKKFLILDEALSNIDKENIKNIENFLLDDKELTLINVSHHIDNLEKYDEVIKL